MQEITNITALRKNLASNFTKMAAKKMPLEMGKQLANTAGRILSSCKTELHYNQYMGLKKKIDFLE